MDGRELVRQYIDRQDWRIKENANIGYSAQGLNLYLSGHLIEDFWLEEVYPEELARAHREGYVHIHDLRGPLTPYCVGWDLADLLTRGFGGVSGAVHSKPPKHLSTALLQLVNFLFTMQGEAAGAVAVSNWDTLLAPFVRADGLDYPQVKQLVQEFVFNLNVPTRVGGQPPFTNITLDIEPLPGLADKPALVGGIPQPFTYGELRREMRMLQRAFFEVMLEGDAAGRPFTFPIPTIDINHEFPWDDPDLQPLWEATAKYGTPYFANFLSTGRSRDEIRSMCCRLRLDVGKLRKGGLFASHPLTGSIGVVTINLPRLAHEAKHHSEFVNRLREMIREAIRGLIAKRQFVEEMTERGLYPYSRYWLQGVKDSTGSYWGNHFITISVIGVHEARMNLVGEGIDTPSGRLWAEQILDFILDQLDFWQEASEGQGYLFNLEAAPAEGASHRLARLDKETHPRIYTSGPEDAPYYMSGSLLPVGTNWDLFSILEHQTPLQSRYTGGTVLHLWWGERLVADAAKVLVKKTFEAFPIPYVTITPTFSVCPKHGYMAGEHEKCPECGATCEVYSRVVGYLRPVQQWNQGKQAEFKERWHFNREMLPRP